MKKYLIAVSILALATCATADAAQTQIFGNDTFVSVLGGWNSHPDLSLGAAGPTGVNDGYNVGARIGTALPISVPGFTVDADYFFNRSGYSVYNARLNSSSVMGDLVYHLPLDWPVSLYGGAGLGAVNDNLSGSVHGSSMVFGWQALGGVEYPLAPGTALFAEYRYQNAHDANVGALFQGRQHQQQPFLRHQIPPLTPSQTPRFTPGRLLPILGV